MAAAKKKTMIRRSPIIMVSSTVYGIEPLLDQIAAQLRIYGYKVLMSRRGTIQLSHGKSAFTNCLDAVDGCDLFLGIITGRYGSGVDRFGLSITHKEVLRAIKKDKPRWFLVHHDVTVARQLLNPVRTTRQNKQRKCFCYQPTQILDNINIIDMYELAMMSDIPFEKRTDNWVQPFMSHQDVKDYIEAQFEDIGRIREMLSQKVTRRKK